MTVNFRKTLVSGLVAASLAAVSGGVMANPVNVAVTFTGTIVDNTCDTPTVTDSTGNIVDFGQVSLANFGPSVGDYAAEQDFSLTFSNCGTDVGNVKVTFTGPEAVDAASLKNISGSATGVGVRVFGGPDTDTELTINSDDAAATGVYTSLTSTGSHQLPFKARMVRTTVGADALTVGTLDTQGTLVVHYQ